MYCWVSTVKPTSHKFFKKIMRFQTLTSIEIHFLKAWNNKPISTDLLCRLCKKSPLSNLKNTISNLGYNHTSHFNRCPVTKKNQHDVSHYKESKSIKWCKSLYQLAITCTFEIKHYHVSQIWLLFFPLLHGRTCWHPK